MALGQLFCFVDELGRPGGKHTVPGGSEESLPQTGPDECMACNNYIGLQSRQRSTVLLVPLEGCPHIRLPAAQSVFGDRPSVQAWRRAG